MGKNRKRNKRNRQQNGNQHGPNNRKRQRRGGRYWIEDCPEKIVENPALTVLLTRVELNDDHPTSKKKNEGEPEDVHQAFSSVEKEEGPKADVVSKENVEETKKDIGNEPKNNDAAEPCADSTIKEDLGIEDENNKSLPDSEQPVQQQTEKSHLEAVDDVTHTKDLAPRICIKRDASSVKGKPKKRFARTNFQHLPDGDCGDGIKNPYPNMEVADKYWAQRHRLFSRFDEGIQLDKESWYSVTPEAIARHIADRMVQDYSEKIKDLVVLDAFCGAGGNAIALAQKEEVSRVVCVDIDREKLRLAANNASVYKIPSNKLLFICADACQVLKRYQNGALVENVEKKDTANTKTEDLLGYPTGGIDMLPANLNSVFLSPPWGGVEYESIGPKSFALKCIKLQNGEDGDAFLELSARAVPKDDGKVACFLPRNTNGWEVAKSALRAGISGILEVEQNILNDKFKAITIYVKGVSH